MALWTKDSITRSPLIVYTRAEIAPDGLVRVVFNPADGGVVGIVYNVIGGEPVTVGNIEMLLEASGGLTGG